MTACILITGSNGFVGRHLVDAMQTHSVNFELLHHSNFLTSNTLPQKNLETVIHLAGRAHILREASHDPYGAFYKANCEYALNVAKAAAKRGLKRFVYVSTLGVYGKSSSETVICEDTAIDPIDDYSKSKREAEIQLEVLGKELDFELVIVRPALVYGHDAPGNICQLFKLIDRLPVIPIAEKKNRRALVYVENLVDFLIVTATHPNAADKIFNIADDSISTYELIVGFARGMKKKAIFFSMPRFIWKALLSLAGKQKMYQQIFEDLIVDMSHVGRELEWQPRFETRAALEKSGHIFIQRKCL